ncbi:endonuclease/exonuclease/phosphatase family protein [Streptomyces niveus]|uniref:endonuclease/exonuclease/phosphatase family protein n=1 Tax=Streptomyces niveus TaxID=193462 RepID=UPI00367E4E52
MQDTLTFVGWNVEHGKRGREAAEMVASWEPDVFCMQEAQPDQIDTLAGILSMDAYPAAETEAGTHTNVIFLKRGGPLVFDRDHQQGWAAWHAPANVTVRLRNPDGALSPRILSLVSEHSCYWSADRRLREAEWYHTLAKPDWMTIAIGDWNSYRNGGGPTNEEWKQYADRAFWTNRTYRRQDGTRVSDDRPDREMLDAGYAEAARLAVELGASREEALKPASGYREQLGRPRGAAYNVDRAYLTRNLRRTVRAFGVHDTHETRPVSDHAPQILTVDTLELVALMHTPLGTALPSAHRLAYVPAS